MRCNTCKYCIDKDESSATAKCNQPDLPRNAKGEPRPILLYQYACGEYEYQKPEPKKPTKSARGNKQR